MKLNLIVCFLLLPFASIAQTVQFNVKGTVNNHEKPNYAYLVNSGGRQLFMMTPIVNGAFQFKGSADLEGEFLKYAYLILDERANITAEEANSKLKQRVWNVRETPSLISFVLEDITFEIEAPEKVNSAKVVEGGFMTKQSKEYGQAIRDKDQITFIKKYPDSPIGLYGLQVLLRFFELPDKDKSEGTWGDPREMYGLLSERLKGSKQGIALKKKLDEIYP